MRNVHSDMEVFMRTPVCGRFEADLTPLPNHGPIQETALPPGNCGPCAGKVAVIDVDGLLVNFDPVGPYSAGENPVAIFQEKLNAAAADPAVRAVVLRINSPGGGTAATDLMAHALLEFRHQTGKPVVACLLDLGTGGAYYLASSCDRVVAIPTAVVGGIGVLLNLYYLEVAMEQWNVFTAPIKAGERIDMGTSQRKMTDEEREMLTGMAREYHNQFKQAVLQGRPRIKADAAIFDGRILTASQNHRRRFAGRRRLFARCDCDGLPDGERRTAPVGHLQPQGRAGADTLCHHSQPADPNQCHSRKRSGPRPESIAVVPLPVAGRADLATVDGNLTVESIR